MRFLTNAHYIISWYCVFASVYRFVDVTSLYSVCAC